MPGSPASVSRRVLLIDDDATFLRHAERFLSQDDALRVVGTATSADEGVVLARSLRPDVVLLDLSMPETDGFAALPMLLEASPGSAVVALTMLEDERYRERARALGAAGFVPKSRLVEDLRSEIDRLPVPEGADGPAAAAQADAPPEFPERVTTGIAGLDQILRGGLPQGEVYLVQGGPGTGKTTLGLQFLLTGVAEGETALYLTLSQTERSLGQIARSHGWSLGAIPVREFRGTTGQDATQTVFHSTEVELEEVLASIRSAVHEVGPARVVVDTIADVRVLAGDATRYRRDLLDLRQFLHEQGCTALFLDDTPDGGGDRELQNQAQGVVALEQEAPEYGDVRRRLQIVKMRATPFLSGYHNFTIETGGLAVFPRVKAGGLNGYDAWAPLSSGVPELDTMLGGGLREGSACLVAGPAGSGKTAVAFQFAYAAVERGERAAVFLFNERLETFAMRAASLGMPVEEHVEAGRLVVQQINTGGITPSEFGQRVRAAVEEGGARVVVIDSLSGYINAMLQRHLLVSQMHELVTFLSQRGVLTLLVADQHGSLAASDPAGPAHVSYLADSVILLRYQENDGWRRRTIAVLKQRHGPHALAAHGLTLGDDGVTVGGPVDGFVGLTLDPPLIATLYSADGGSDGHASGAPALRDP